MKALAALLPAIVLSNAYLLADNPQWVVYDTTSFGPLNSGWVMSIAIDEDNTKWIVCSEGLVRFDNDGWHAYRYEEAGWYHFNVPTSIAIDQLGNKWMGNRPTMGSAGGLFEFSSEGTWRSYYADSSGLPSNAVYDVAVDDSARMWFATDNGLATYDGTGWKNFTTSNSGIPSNLALCIEIDKAGGKWIGTGSGLAHFDGTSWEVWDTENSGLPGNTIHCIAMDNSSNQVWVGISYLRGYEAAIAKFDGISWSVYDKSNSGFPVNLITRIEVDLDGAVWFGSYDGAVKFDGTNWKTYDSANSGLPENIVEDIVVDRYGNKWMTFLGVNIGLAVFNEPGVVSVDGDGTHASETYSLSQCYPNPFNPSTAIRYELPKSLKVRLSVYDLLGREVAVLVNDKTGPGNFEVKFDASGLASGVYFCRMHAGSFVETRKLLLTR